MTTIQSVIKGRDPLDHESERRLGDVLNDDPGYVYSEEELDAIEAIDPELAYRLDRAQVEAERAGPVTVADGPIDEEAVRAAIDEARRILAQDGGDIEYAGLGDDATVYVTMRGACAGCPRSPLDLKNVVERLVRARAPQIRQVANRF